MSHAKQTPAAGGATGASENVSLGNDHFQLDQGALRNQVNSAAVAAARADLQRECVSECLRIASVLAGYAADSVELHFDLLGEHELKAALSHFREGSRVYRELLQAQAGGGRR
jgi:hypothetical protein